MACACVHLLLEALSKYISGCWFVAYESAANELTLVQQRSPVVKVELEFGCIFALIVTFFNM